MPTENHGSVQEQRVCPLVHAGDLDLDFENVYVACPLFFSLSRSNPGSSYYFIIGTLNMCADRKSRPSRRAARLPARSCRWPWPWLWKRLCSMPTFFLFFFSRSNPGSSYYFIIGTLNILCRQKITDQSKSSVSARSFMPVTLTVTLKTFM